MSKSYKTINLNDQLVGKITQSKTYLVTYDVYHVNRKVTERHTTKVSANLWDWWNNFYDDGEVKYTLIFAIEI